MTTVKIKTRELIGPALDWAVAICEELAVKKDPMGFGSGSEAGYWIWPAYCQDTEYRKIGRGYSPSTRWADGGPLMVKYHITTSSPKALVHRHGGALNGWNASGSWTACNWERGVTGKRAVAWDKDSPLVAVCRVIIIVKLGDEVDVPAELVEKAS